MVRLGETIIGKIEILGVRVNPFTISQLNGLIKECIRSDKRCIIAHQNLHGVFFCHRDAQVRSFYLHSHYVHVDSMPMIFLARFLGYPVQRGQRVTFVDWVIPLFHEASLHGWRVFYLGSRPRVASKGARILQERFGKLSILVEHGYFNDTPGHRENENVIRQINIFRPHILMVGMGMPRQEQWILRSFPKLKANVVLNCGGCMDYIAGVTAIPPRWLGRAGLEWLCRLIYEPRRLWRRCLYEPFFLLKPLIKDLRARSTRKAGKKKGSPFRN